MRSCALLLLVVAAGRADDTPSDNPSPAALKELEGRYTVLGASAGGEEAPAAVCKAAHVRITGEELVVTMRDKAHPAKITRLDPKAKPHVIDVSPTDGPEKGKTFPGIYTVEKGELTLALAEKGERPKEFGPAPGVLLLKLRKEPPGAKD